MSDIENYIGNTPLSTFIEEIGTNKIYAKLEGEIIQLVLSKIVPR